MKNKKLELTWIGKDNQPRLEQLLVGISETEGK